MRYVFLIALALLGFSCILRADVTTQPATQPDDPKAAIVAWNDFEDQTPDQVMDDFYVTSDGETALARFMAKGGVDMARILKYARTKWGNDAEAQVAKAAQTDTLTDDKNANVQVIDADHVVLKFQNAEITDTPLIRVNGKWMIDVGALLKAEGASIPEMIGISSKYAGLFAFTARDVENGKYSDPNQLAAYLKAQVDQLQAAP